MYKPTVSLILTTYNSKDNLTKTLDSIDAQDYPNIEVVIKDGGSTDGTLDVINEYVLSGKYEVKTESKPDTGIYDAMNQGYELSTGDVVAFFNDMFVVSDAVSKLVGAIYPEQSDADGSFDQSGVLGDEVIGAHADLIYANGDKVVRTWHMGEQKSIMTGWMPGHPTLYIKREVYEKYGLYNTSYRIAADYEFMVRILKDGTNRLAYVPETLVSMFYGGTSNSTFGSYIDSLKEGNRALRTNHVHPAFIVDCIRTVRVLLQFSSIMQFVKFGIVGVSNTIISYVVYLMTLWGLSGFGLSWDYYAANIAEYIIGVAWSFYWNNKYVFTKSENGERSLVRSILKTYISYGFTGIVLTNVFAFVWVELLGISKIIAPMVTLIVTVPINFILNKLWAFKEK